MGEKLKKILNSLFKDKSKQGQEFKEGVNGNKESENGIERKDIKNNYYSADVLKNEMSEAVKKTIKVDDLWIKEHMDPFFDKTFDIKKVSKKIGEVGIESVKEDLATVFLYADSKEANGDSYMTYKEVVLNNKDLVKDSVIKVAKKSGIKDIIKNASKKAKDHNEKIEKKTDEKINKKLNKEESI